METDSRTVPGMKCEQCWGTPGGEGHCRWPRKVRSPPEQGGSASRQEGALLWRGDLLPPFRSGPACRLRGWPCLQDILPTLQPLHGTYSAGDKQSHSEPPLRKPDRGATGHQAQPPPSAFGGEGSGPAPTPSRRRKEVVPSSHPFPLASLGPDSRDSRLAPTGGTFVHLQERRRPRHARAYGAGGGGGRGRAGDQQGDRRARARAPARGGAGQVPSSPAEGSNRCGEDHACLVLQVETPNLGPSHLPWVTWPKQAEPEPTPRSREDRKMAAWDEKDDFISRPFN
ncbi:voltage-gated hydrogen channel 1 isoform X4 [Mustela putorius furo]|uniref:Voltage-gated hydrogen channel 1 isoform X4 n=1 Tax=Mustela putorius furo TaxID=9669 RepID=A0A8U0RRM2_MUSPF|nr:voltage-gated hydrogen channel 1 isoform X4 [Mustela putorius furo]